MQFAAERASSSSEALADLGKRIGATVRLKPRVNQLSTQAYIEFGTDKR
jgi:hypothetical protein